MTRGRHADVLRLGASDSEVEGQRGVPSRRGTAPAVAASGVAATPLDSSGLYSLLVESVTDYAIFALDPSGRIVTWNAGAERIKGYRVDEIIGRHFSIFYPPEEVARGKTEWELAEAKRAGRVEDEGWRVRKDGTQFWANVVITALRDPHGVLVGFAKVTRDLSERRAHEEQLRQSEERFRLLVESVTDYAIFMLDPDGVIATWNEGAERLTGYTAAEAIGRYFSSFHPPDDLGRGVPDWELRVASQDGRFEDEGWRIRKDGSRFWANVMITPLHDAGGRLLGFAQVTRDLTQRRLQTERALADARRVAAAEATNRAKSEFLTTLSHELRTPLNAIAGYADLMKLQVGGPVSPQQREYLERIGNSQKHLLSIINDLLNYSRLEAGQISFQPAPVALDQVLDRTLPMITIQAIAKEITIARDVCDADVIGWADQTKVEQIVLNLLSNAVKFTPRHGTVTVSCFRDGDIAALRVSDTGPGIPPEMAADVFEPFVQLGRTLTSSQEGTGLGLAISRDLARAMQGDLRLETAAGGGASFTLTLRAGSDEASSRAP